MLELIEKTARDGAVDDTVVLTYALRQKSRQRVRLASGREAAIVLIPGEHLHDGDRLRAADGTTVRVRAASEAVSTARTDDPLRFARLAAYCASKHAVIGLTRALAVEVARSGVTINAVCPGWVDTRMTDEAIARIAQKTGRAEADARRALEAMSPQKRLIAPEEVAHAVLSLLPDEARGIHGQAIAIDGGQTL